jgi:ribonucleoside-diphosphate reductase alpha chain
MIKERPDVLYGKTYRMITGCGKFYITINRDEKGEKVFEVFSQLGKTGGCAASQTGTQCRLISMAFRAGLTEDDIIKKIAGSICNEPATMDGVKILSCSDAIGLVLRVEKDYPDNGRILCPDCGNESVSTANLVNFECASCGYKYEKVPEKGSDSSN